MIASDDKCATLKIIYTKEDLHSMFVHKPCLYLAALPIIMFGK